MPLTLTGHALTKIPANTSHCRHSVAGPLVNLLLERGANVSLVTDEEVRLFLTALRGHLKLVKFFLANALQMEPTCM